MAQAQQPIDSGSEYGIYSNYGNDTTYNNTKAGGGPNETKVGEHTEQTTYSTGAGVAQATDEDGRNLRGGP